MTKIGKRIFYDNRNGEVIAIVGERSGHVRPTTVEEDIESFPKLQERNRETFDYIDLECGDFAQDFDEGELAAVDTGTKELKFVYRDDEAQTPRSPLSKEVEELKRRTSASESAVLDVMEMIFDGIH